MSDLKILGLCTTLGVLVMAWAVTHVEHAPVVERHVVSRIVPPMRPACVEWSTAQARAWADAIDAENQTLLVETCLEIRPGGGVP